MTIDERLAGVRALPTDERLAHLDAAVLARVRAVRAQGRPLSAGMLGLAALAALSFGVVGGGTGEREEASSSGAEMALGVPAALAPSGLLGGLE